MIKMTLAFDNGPEIPSGLQAFSLPIPPVCHPPELRCASASAVAMRKCKCECKCSCGVQVQVQLQGASASASASVIMQRCMHKVQVQVRLQSASAVRAPSCQSAILHRVSFCVSHSASCVTSPSEFSRTFQDQIRL